MAGQRSEEGQLTARERDRVSGEEGPVGRQVEPEGARLEYPVVAATLAETGADAGG